MCQFSLFFVMGNIFSSLPTETAYDALVAFVGSPLMARFDETVLHLLVLGCSVYVFVIAAKMASNLSVFVTTGANITGVALRIATTTFLGAAVTGLTGLVGLLGAAVTGLTGLVRLLDPNPGKAQSEVGSDSDENLDEVGCDSYENLEELKKEYFEKLGKNPQGCNANDPRWLSEQIEN